MEDIIGFDEQIGFFNAFRKATQRVNNKLTNRNLVISNTVKNLVQKAKQGQKLNSKQMSFLRRIRAAQLAKKKGAFSRFFKK